MAMAAGSVAVDNAGNPSGTGAAWTIYNATYAAMIADIPAAPTLGATADPYDPLRPATQADIDAANGMVIRTKQGHAKTCNTIAQLVPYITTNAEVNPSTLKAHVSTEVLGRTPNPNDPGVAIQPPASPVDVPLTGKGTVA